MLSLSSVLGLDNQTHITKGEQVLEGPWVWESSPHFSLPVAVVLPHLMA